jgi:hypothetical protein
MSCSSTSGRFCMLVDALLGPWVGPLGTLGHQVPNILSSLKLVVFERILLKLVLITAHNFKIHLNSHIDFNPIKR